MGVQETTPTPPPHLRLQATSWLTEITFHARRLVFAELSNSTAQEGDDDPLKRETHLRMVFMKVEEEQDGKQELQKQNGKQELKNKMENKNSKNKMENKNSENKTENKNSNKS